MKKLPTGKTSIMRILLEQSGYPLNNMGDLAMLQTAVTRLNCFWSDASIQVITTAPEKLAEICPNTQPLSPLGRQIWFSPFVTRLHQLFPKCRATELWTEIEWAFRRKAPSLVRSFLDFKLRKRFPESAKNLEAFMEAIYNADLVVACGGGYITDVFKQHAISAINTLELANRLGKPTVMLGQGLGPLRDQELLARVKAVLPSIDLIALREKRAGVPILNSIGISQERMIITGDDAIELAYQARTSKLDIGIGVNLRVSGYSNISPDLLEEVRVVLQNAAEQFRAPLIPVPISHNAFGSELSDSMTIQKLLKGYNDRADGGQHLDTPIKVINQVGRCRVVVTGSYHAGVFALAQGIPIVGLVKSEYYADKFLGLTDQFGVGCVVVRLNEGQLREKLLASINNAYKASEQLRPQILEAARQQIDLGWTAYKRMYKLVKS